mgnify:CR=1 FL=1
MLDNVLKNPRFLINKRIKLPRETMAPNFYLSKEHNIILNGLIDWIEYLPETDSLHIIDFKTGKNRRMDLYNYPFIYYSAMPYKKEKLQKQVTGIWKIINWRRRNCLMLKLPTEMYLMLH